MEIKSLGMQSQAHPMDLHQAPYRGLLGSVSVAPRLRGRATACPQVADGRGTGKCTRMPLTMVPLAPWSPLQQGHVVPSQVHVPQRVRLDPASLHLLTRVLHPI